MFLKSKLVCVSKFEYSRLFKLNVLEYLTYFKNMIVWSTLYLLLHYNDVIMSSMASQITSVSIVCPTGVQAQIIENIKAPSQWPLWGRFTEQRASNAENVPIWWGHHGPSTGLVPWTDAQGWTKLISSYIRGRGLKGLNGNNMLQMSCKSKLQYYVWFIYIIHGRFVSL